MSERAKKRRHSDTACVQNRFTARRYSSFDEETVRETNDKRCGQRADGTNFTPQKEKDKKCIKDGLNKAFKKDEKVRYDGMSRRFSSFDHLQDANKKVKFKWSYHDLYDVTFTAVRQFARI